MILPEFVFVSCPDLTGGEYILFTRAPYWIMRAYRFENDESLENFIIKYNILNECAIIPGYNILIACIGSIEHVTLTPLLTVPGGAKNTFNNLINFYEKDRIKGNQTRLKKYLKK